MSKSLIPIFTFIKELHNSIITQIPAPISKGCSVQGKTVGKWINKSRDLRSSWWPGLEDEGWGPGSFLAFICHHQRNSIAGFAVDWLASCLLYICHADFNPSKIRSSCHWSVSLVEEKRNHAKSFRRY